jgi:hypothetical protein
VRADGKALFVAVGTAVAACEGSVEELAVVTGAVDGPATAGVRASVTTDGFAARTVEDSVAAFSTARSVKGSPASVSAAARRGAVEAGRDGSPTKASAITSEILERRKELEDHTLTARRAVWAA